MAADGSWQDICDTLGISIDTDPQSVADYYGGEPYYEESPEEEAIEYTILEEGVLRNVLENEGNLSFNERQFLRECIECRISSDGGKWNGKIYGGRNEHLHIYVDNKKQYLKDYLDAYHNVIGIGGDRYWKIVSEIKENRKKMREYQKSMQLEAMRRRE